MSYRTCVSLAFAIAASANGANGPTPHKMFIQAAQLASRREWTTAASAYEAAFTERHTDGDISSQSGAGVAMREHVDNRVGYARVLKKLSRYEEALVQLDIAEGVLSAVTRDGISTRAEQLHSQAAVTFERGVVLACAGRLDDAIASQVW